MSENLIYFQDLQEMNLIWNQNLLLELSLQQEVFKLIIKQSKLKFGTLVFIFIFQILFLSYLFISLFNLILLYYHDIY